MTDTPDPPPPAPLGPPPGLAVSPSLPPGTPAGRPRIWQALLLLAVFGGLAGGSCAAFLSTNLTQSSVSQDLWSFLFVATVPFAAGALALLVFRLWRRRLGEHWPSVGQAFLLGVAGVGLAIGGCGGWTVTMNAAVLLPAGVVLAAVFVAGTALAVGAAELFVIGIVRLIFQRPGAR